MSIETFFVSDMLCMNWNKGEESVRGGIIVDILTQSTLGLFVLWKVGTLTKPLNSKYGKKNANG